MIIAEVSIVPLGVGPSVSKYVKEAVRTLEKSNVRVIRGPMGTVIEAESLDVIWDAVRKAHEAVFEMGAPRVVTTLKIDERRDKEHTVESKLKALE